MGNKMSNNPIIITLNRNLMNNEILIKILKEEGYDPVGVNNLEELDHEIEQIDKINLVLMDISGFNRQVWKSCERLRVLEIPFLVLSPHQHHVIEKESRMYGAEGFLVKPLVVKELLVLIKNLIQI